LHRGLAYVAGSYGFTVFDPSAPQAPQFVAQYYVNDYVYDLALAGTHAYLSLSSGAVHVVNVSVPSAPTLQGAASIYGGEALGVAVHPPTQRMLIAAASAGLVLFDVSTPSAPVKIGVGSTQYANEPEFVDDDTVIVADGAIGLRMYDIVATTPTALYPYPYRFQLVARHSGLAPAFALSVDVSRRVAYVGTTIGISASMLSIVSLQPVPGVDPIVANNLTVHASIGLASGTFGVASRGTMLFSANGYTGFRAYDVATLSAPVELAAVATPHFASHAIADPTGAYLLVAEIGRVLRYHLP
jgi:hypothetical protein